jgi:hypothetical protein
LLKQAYDAVNQAANDGGNKSRLGNLKSQFIIGTLFNTLNEVSHQFSPCCCGLGISIGRYRVLNDYSSVLENGWIYTQVWAA